MLLPLLTTKLTVPPASTSLVTRERLLERLQDGLHYRVTLVTAPPGYGKTTLLAQWGAHPAFSPDHLVWINLDERDNDSNRFWMYFFAALQKMKITVTGELPGVELLDQPMTEDEFVAQVHQVVAEIPGECVLVLDDFHLITANSVHSKLAFLLQNLPPRLHLYFVSRVEPPLRLAQLRVRGQLLELDTQDLRFTWEESQGFLTSVMGLELSPEDIYGLNARTEGWIAGLQLAAMGIKKKASDDRQSMRADYLNVFSDSSNANDYLGNSLIDDYLAEQVLDRQKPEIKHFLLETSILTALTGPLCDVLVNQGKDSSRSGKSLKQNIRSMAMLERLKKENLFLDPLDNERRWYRYHPLFASFLQQRLRELNLSRWRELHRRAAEWYVHAGLQEEAIQHALRGGSYELAARLIEKVAGHYYQRNEVLTILRWIQAIPQKILYGRPQLCLHYAWALALNGQLEAVEPVLKKVSEFLGEIDQHDENPKSFEQWNQEMQDLQEQIINLRSYLARFSGEISEAIFLSQRALEKTPPNQASDRATRLILLGRAQYLAGDMEPARRNLTEALQLTRLVGSELSHLNAIHYLAQLYQVQGRLHRAYALYKSAEAYLADCGRPFMGGIEQVGLGGVMCEWNDLEKAAGYIHTGLHLAQQSGDYVFLRDTYLASLRLEIARGHYKEANEALHRLENLVIRSHARVDTSLVIACRARLLLAQKDLIGLEGWLQACGLSSSDELSFDKEFAHITLAWVLLSFGRTNQAGPLIARLLEAAKAGQRKGRVIELLLLQALLYNSDKKIVQALRALKSALVLAAPEGYLTTFLEYGASLAALIHQLCRSNVEIGYQPGWKRRREQNDLQETSLPAGGLAETRFALHLLNEFASRGLLGDGRVPEQFDGQPPASPLSERELQVLRLIASGKSYQEISRELLVALSTVQTHVKHAYYKLDAHNGLEATARARQLNLIP